jgi:DNA-binding transcriptional LysR family regulator
MNDIHFNSVDLNLLRVLSVMLEERSVTRTGARLGLTQSAVSHALRRLRDLLGDPLFVRDAGGMRPTARAAEIAGGVQAALNQLQQAVTANFDPRTTERRFTVVAGGYICAVLMPGVAERMRAHAPGAQLRIRGFGGDLSDRLNSGQVDVIIGDGGIVSDRFSYRQLLEEPLVWVVRQGHPIAQQELTIETLASIAHVAIDNPQDRVDEDPVPIAGETPLGRSSVWFDRGALESELARRGLVHHIGVTVPDTYSAIAIVRRSDMAALLPRRLVEMAGFGINLAVLEPPYPHSPIGLGAHFRPDRTNEPAFQWFLGLLASEAAAL